MTIQSGSLLNKPIAVFTVVIAALCAGEGLAGEPELVLDPADPLTSPLLEGSDLIETGRPFAAPLRSQIVPGKTELAELVEMLGPPFSKAHFDGVPHLVWEHQIIEQQWKAVGGDPDWQRGTQVLHGVGRVLNALAYMGSIT